jgi:dihydroanticapsin dehydrogenase
VYASIDSFQPIGNPGASREIAHLSLFLASDEASLITGSIIAADVGKTTQKLEFSRGA